MDSPPYQWITFPSIDKCRHACVINLVGCAFWSQLYNLFFMLSFPACMCVLYWNLVKKATQLDLNSAKARETSTVFVSVHFSSLDVNAKISPAKWFPKTCTFEQLQFETSTNLWTFLNFFLMEVNNYKYGFGIFWFEQIPLNNSEDIFWQCWLDWAFFWEKKLLVFIPNFLRRPQFWTPRIDYQLIVNWPPSRGSLIANSKLRFAHAHI